MDNKQQNIEFKDQKIVDIKMEREVKKSFMEYAMSVIISRALPDARDGLKPVHRRILYAMYEDKLTYENPFRKSATTVGNVLGRYHPHGDTAVYGSMVRLAQPFSLRYPLVEGHGNFGNIDGDGAAAYRYTEARMAKLANLMLADIEKDVVDFTPNFDNTRKEPEVLPSRFPNLLVNGSVGIAVGMATNIPPHNLGEVIDGTVYLMEHPEADVRELMTFIKGPDFPTYATIHGTAGIYEAYATGRGKITVRARAEVFEEKRRIEIYEIPYQVNKSMLVESIANLVKDKRVEGITALRDESGRHGMKIVIEYRRDANGQVILNQLYKYTQLQDTCAVNMLALVNGEPKVLGLKELLSVYIKHQEEVVRRRTQFELEKATKRAHILEGLKIAIENIDEVIAIIRGSKSIPDAKDQLTLRFGLDDAQTQAIVEMQLGKLSNLETVKIEDELDRLCALIAELRSILADESKLIGIIKEEMLDIKAKFGDERRTRIEEAENEIVLEDLIERHSCVITATRGGYFKRMPAREYTAQRRGGKGIIGMKTKDEDDVVDVMVVNSHSFLLMFTNKGKVFAKKAYMIPEAGRTAKGTNIVNLLELTEGEFVTSVISIDGFGENEYFVMVTKYGVIKRANVMDFEFMRRGGKIAMNLDEGDELLYVRKTAGESDIIIATREGKAVRFNENEARVMGRTARGVRGIRLRGDDYVVGAEVIDDSKKLITITQKGYGKKSDFEGFTAHSRGTMGVICHKISEKTGYLAGIAAVCETDDLMIITDEGVIIRTPAADIPTYGNNTAGVIVMRLSEGASVVNFTLVHAEEEKKAEEAALEEEATEAAEIRSAEEAGMAEEEAEEEAAEPASDEDEI